MVEMFATIFKNKKKKLDFYTFLTIQDA